MVAPAQLVAQVEVSIEGANCPSVTSPEGAGEEAVEGRPPVHVAASLGAWVEAVVGVDCQGTCCMMEGTAPQRATTKMQSVKELRTTKQKNLVHSQETHSLNLKRTMRRDGRIHTSGSRHHRKRSQKNDASVLERYQKYAHVEH